MFITEAVCRSVMVRFLSESLPVYTVNEFPKSGGTWVGQMLAAALEIPFPRNCMPRLESSIMHGHFLNPYGMKNVLCVWRDGRDVIVSWYHHCLFENEHGNSKLVAIVRDNLQFEDYDNIKKNLPQFINYTFCQQRHPNFSWVDFVRSWHRRNDVVNVRYEDLRANTVSELKRIVHELADMEMSGMRMEEIVEEFSFSRMAGRENGEENKNSFMRKGVVGDWKNHFSLESRQLFDHYAGNELIILGYEKNHDWVKNG